MADRVESAENEMPGLMNLREKYGPSQVRSLVLLYRRIELIITRTALEGR